MDLTREQELEGAINAKRVLRNEASFMQKSFFNQTLHYFLPTHHLGGNFLNLAA
jgi:hypothetical protein